MIRHFFTAALLFALLALPTGAWASSPGDFEELTIYFELNETDGDAEVVMFAKAPEGMDRLNVFGPTGAKRVEMKAKGHEDVGQGQLRIESAEPSLEEVKQAFPEGEYTFTARTVSGQFLRGTATLSHDLLPAPSFHPAEEEVDPANAVVRWTPVPGAASYLVEIEQDDLGAKLTVTVGPGVTSLRIPRTFLVPGTEYEIGVTTITSEGNVTVAESSFTTTDD